MPVRFWKWAAVCIAAGIILWWKLEQGEINKMRNELLSRQRAVKEQLGPRWFPLRDKIEGWTVECAAKDFKEVVAEKLVDDWDFRTMPGIYLRLAQGVATSPESIREAATKSLHDGFTSCLLLVNNPHPIAGPECRTTGDCAKGQLCNDYQHCSEYSQPYNLRLAYRTMYVMTDEWTADVQDLTKKLAVRGTVATFDAINKYDLPAAAELLQRAKYFLVVVDEPASEVDKKGALGLPEVADAGAADDQSIPTAPHMARVCAWRLADDAKVLATRKHAAGQLMGGKEATHLATRIAKRRQANSCALALAVREAIGVEPGAKVPEKDPILATDGGAPEGDAGRGSGTSPSDAGAP
ncbi:MAG: hypothetical protein DRI90_01010 [Deltaproteobacteria bacterium]|nr:MAG: hypothetical protein DRI90_01010 [Deltaproteobacteria bacterium]